VKNFHQQDSSERRRDAEDPLRPRVIARPLPAGRIHGMVAAHLGEGGGRRDVLRAVLTRRRVFLWAPLAHLAIAGSWHPHDHVASQIDRDHLPDDVQYLPDDVQFVASRWYGKPIPT
jgi:hypothetical protein